MSNPNDAKIAMSLDDIIAMDGIKEEHPNRSRSRSRSRSRNRSRSRSRSRSNFNQQDHSRNRSCSQSRQSRSRSVGPSSYYERRPTMGFNSNKNNYQNGFRPGFKREGSLPAYVHNNLSSRRSRSRTPHRDRSNSSFRNRSRSRSQSRARSSHNRQHTNGYNDNYSNNYNGSSFHNSYSNQYNGYQTYHPNSQDRGGRSYRPIYDYHRNGIQNDLSYANQFQGHTRPAPHFGNFYRRPYSQNDLNSLQSAHRGSYRGAPFNFRGPNSRPYRSRSRSRAHSPRSHEYRPFSPRGRGSWQSFVPRHIDHQVESVFLRREIQARIAAEQKVPYKEAELFTPQAFQDLEDSKPPPAWSKPTTLPVSERFKTYITGFEEDMNPRRSF